MTEALETVHPKERNLQWLLLGRRKTVRVDTARDQDIPNWLNLASEVECLFGRMVDDPGFHRALRRNIERGTAYCVRENDGASGTPLMGGLLFSPKPPAYEIGWLAVARKWRRQRVGHLLVQHVFDLVQPPGALIVTTFGDDIEAGQPARRFYEGLDFEPAELAVPSPEGGSRQIFRRVFQSEPSSPGPAGK